MNSLDYGYIVSYVNSVKGKGITNIHQAEKLEKEIMKLCPDKAAINVIFLKNDFHNLKVFMKNPAKSFDSLKKLIISPCVYQPEKIYADVTENKLDRLPQGLKTAAKMAFTQLNKKNYQLADVLIDKIAMDYTFEKAKETDISFLKELILLENTLTNIKIALRCCENNKDEAFMDMALSFNTNLNRKALIKAAVSGKTALLEYLSATKYNFEDFDKYYTEKTSELLERSKYTFFGIEPLISCIYYLENKIRE